MAQPGEQAGLSDLAAAVRRLAAENTGAATGSRCTICSAPPDPRPPRRRRPLRDSPHAMPTIRLGAPGQRWAAIGTGGKEIGATRPAAAQPG